MFTDKEMKEMYEKHKNEFFDFKDFEEEVVKILAEEASVARKRADKAVENREVE
jgi:NACalpha-BTF3-like transcription factor